MAMRGRTVPQNHNLTLYIYVYIYIELSPLKHFSYWLPVQAIVWKVQKELKLNFVHTFYLSFQ